MALVGKPYTLGQTSKECRKRTIFLDHHLWQNLLPSTLEPDSGQQDGKCDVIFMHHSSCYSVVRHLEMDRSLYFRQSTPLNRISSNRIIRLIINDDEKVPSRKNFRRRVKSSSLSCVATVAQSPGNLAINRGIHISGECNTENIIYILCSEFYLYFKLKIYINKETWNLYEYFV